MILFFDTETTGFVDFRMPPTDPSQPHLVQFAALLTEDDGTERSRVSLIINPGVEIPQKAAEVHGITTDLARRVGLSPKVACAIFKRLADLAGRHVAHNLDFDMTVMEVEFHRAGMAGPQWDILEGRGFCTMKTATPICRIPHANPRKPDDFKWPKLEEAIEHFFGEKMIDAHDAMQDVIACKRIYFAILEAQADA